MIKDINDSKDTKHIFSADNIRRKLDQYYFKGNQRILSPLRVSRQDLYSNENNICSNNSKSRITSRFTFTSNMNIKNLDFSPLSRKKFNSKLLKLVNNSIRKKNKLNILKNICKGQREISRNLVWEAKNKLANSYRIDAPKHILLK